MGDVYFLDGAPPIDGSDCSSSSLSNDTIVLTPEQRNRISRDIRHLDRVMARARSVDVLAGIIAKATGAEERMCLLAARRVGLFLSTGKQ